MLVYFMEFSDPNDPFFLRQTKFQQCMLRMTHWILTSLDSPTKIPNNRFLYVEVHCVLTEYKNRKAKAAYYLI